MQKILNILKVNCTRYDFILPDRILFEFENYLIILDYEISETIQDDFEEFLDEFSSGDFREYTIEELPKGFLGTATINEVIISDYEYLGYREDISEDHPPQKSIALKLFTALNLINKTYPKLILNYNIDINEGYDDSGGGMCPGEPNYIFQIFLNTQNEQLLSFLNNINTLEIPEHQPNLFYCNFLYNYNSLERTKKVNILPSNTKVRRLGYFLLLSDFFLKTPKVPLSRINKKFQDFAVQYEGDLLQHKNTKGIIAPTKTGISAKPYIDVAKDLDWISKVNILQIPGKKMKVYNVLKKQINEKKDNVFILNQLDKMFLLELLIAKDFFYLSVLLELLYIAPQGKCDNAYLNSIFKQHLLNRIEQYISSPNYVLTLQKKTLRDLKEIKNRIQSWEEPEVYLEHVLMPRLNWLFDLGLVNFNKKEKKTHYALTDLGKKLFHHFCFWMDIDYDFIANPEEHVKLFFIHTFDNVYFDGESQNQRSREDINLKINEYIDESFKYFRTLAPNRVLASQAILFTKYKLYLKDNIKVGQKYIENHLEKTATDTFIYKYQRQYSDGYIQKIHK